VFKLEVFDGPLDLLLFLISKNKVSIYDIPISLILEQYMEYIEDLKKMDLEVSSEFIEMAANLMYIKSKMLLPKPPEDEEDPREQLARSLAEYKRYKSVLEPLRKLNENAGTTYTRLMQVMEFDKKHTRVYDLAKLEEAYENVRRHLEYITTSPIKNFKGIVGRKIASVTTKIVTVLRILARSKHTSFLSLFKSAKTRSDIIATFLAVLELSKNDRISINDSGDEIYIDVESKV
jgi:segregation and condensation protein A